MADQDQRNAQQARNLAETQTLSARAGIYSHSDSITLFGQGVSWRDVILGAGGVFLIYKGTTEIGALMSGDDENFPVRFLCLYDKRTKKAQASAINEP